MTDLEAALRGIAAELDGHGLRCALVGGLAVGTRAEPRTTRDVDIAVAIADDEQAEQLVSDLRASGYETTAIIEQTTLHRLATERLKAPGRGLRVVVDLLFSSSGVEPEIALAAEVLELVPGFHVPVAQTGHLIALKLLARDDRRRPQDSDDLRALLSRAGPPDLALARTSCELIVERGAHRGRDLLAALDELIAGSED